MKKILFIPLLFIACSSFAQLSSKITDAINYADSNIITNATRQITAIKVNAALKKVISAIQYIDTSTRFTNPQPINNGNHIISGGDITQEDILVFSVSAANYIIGIDTLSSPDTTITLAAVSSKPRFDVITVNSIGKVQMITGTPADNPAYPNVNTNTQIALGFIYVSTDTTIIVPIKYYVFDISYNNDSTLNIQKVAGGYTLPLQVFKQIYRRGDSVFYKINKTEHFAFKDSTGAGSGTVTSIIVSSPLTGGTITTSGTIGLGTVPIANGGTNNASLSVTAGTIYYGDGSKLIGLAPGTSKQHLTGGTTPAWKDTAVAGPTPNLLQVTSIDSSTTHAIGIQGSLIAASSSGVSIFWGTPGNAGGGSTGINLIGIGSGAVDNVSVNGNIGIGSSALNTTTGILNTGIGIGALYHNTGHDNIAIGYNSGWNGSTPNAFNYVNLFGNQAIADSSFQTVFGSSIGNLRLDYGKITTARKQHFQDKDGTIALLSDITGGSGDTLTFNTSQFRLPSDNIVSIVGTPNAIPYFGTDSVMTSTANATLDGSGNGGFNSLIAASSVSTPVLNNGGLDLDIQTPGHQLTLGDWFGSTNGTGGNINDMAQTITWNAANGTILSTPQVTGIDLSGGTYTITGPGTYYVSVGSLSNALIFPSATSYTTNTIDIYVLVKSAETALLDSGVGSFYDQSGAAVTSITGTGVGGTTAHYQAINGDWHQF